MLKKIIEKTIIIIAIITVAFVAISNLLYTSEIINDVSEKVNINPITVISLITSLAVVVILFAIGVFRSKIKISKRTKIIFLACSIILYVVVNVLWIHTTQGKPVADQKEVEQIAKKIIDGQTEELKNNEYLERNPQQIGTSYFIATIYTIFGGANYHIIQYLNIACNVISILLIYIIMKRFLKEYKFNKWLYFVMCLTFISFILLSTLVYGDYIGLMFSIIGIYMAMKYVESDKIRYICISALSLAVSYIIKSNYLIFILAVIIYLGLYLLKNKDWKKILAIILFVLITILPNTVLKNVITDKLELNKNRSIPSSAYIYMGMNEGSRENGWYNSTMDYAWKDIDDAQRYYPEKLKERVVELVKSPIYTAKFYSKKIISMWTEVQFGSIWYNLPFQANDHEEFLSLMAENSVFLSICEGKVNLALKIYQKALVLLIFFGALWAIWKNRKDISLNLMLLIIIFLGGFFFHVLWEAKSRYILPYVFILIPVSMIGIQQVLDKILEHMNKRKQDKIKER